MSRPISQSVSVPTVEDVASDVRADATPRVAHGHLVRDDIQLLRGVAVLAVLLYHADKHLLPGGYLGVDIFFVLSGFLITGNILKDIERGTFSYASFIARRFRRLLPACYAMLTGTAVLAGFFLTRADLGAFVTQLAGTLSFSSNVVLWRQSGYFDAAASMKLLLHTWSLSVEEQYYLFLPPLLYLGARAGMLRTIAFAIALSLVACFVLMPYKPSAVFYLLPFRAWELLAGSLCAAFTLRAHPVLPAPVKWGAFTVLLLVLVFPPGSTHPGPAALLVVLATAALMPGMLNFGRGRVSRGMIFIGDISYSLYLVHWPLFAVANHVYANEPPMAVKISLMLLSVALAWLSFRFVEQPFRAPSAAPRRKVYSLAAAAGVLVMLFGLILLDARTPAAGSGGGRDGDAPNYGLAKSCNAERDFVARPECQSTGSPSVMLWGDSYAMHLADALVAQQGLPAAARFGFVQATKSQCGPVPGVAPVVGAYRESWAEDCIAFNDSVEKYLAAHPEIGVVVFGSKWRQYFDDEGQDGFMIRTGGRAGMQATLAPADVSARFRALVDRLIASGRQVLIVEPPPPAGFDVYQCVQRKREGLFYIGPSPDCQIDRQAAISRDAGLNGMLNTLGSMPGLRRFSMAPLLCDTQRCRTENEGVSLYRDEGHLSREGSRFLGQQSGLNALISGLVQADEQGMRLTAKESE